MIRSFSPFPYALIGNELSDGLLYKLNSICITCRTRECIAKSYSARKVGVVERCFQGLNYAYVADYEDEDVIWIGFLLKGTKYPPNYRALIKTGYELDEHAISKAIEVFSPGGAAQKSAIDFQKRRESRALHDLKHLISAMQRVVETNNVRIATDRYALQNSQNFEVLQSSLISVFNILGAIKNQIELSDFILAPDTTDVSKEKAIDIFPLFEKNVFMYNVLAEQQYKSIQIRSFSGFIESNRIIKEHFVLLPAILLQNAIKYSKRDSQISVDFSQINGKLRIAVASIGPIIPASERERIWKMGERYVHPNDTSKGGSGFGLFLAKSICDSTGFFISYEGIAMYKENEIEYGKNQFILAEK